MQNYFIIADISKPFIENYIFFYQIVIKESLESEVLPAIKKKGAHARVRVRHREDCSLVQERLYLEMRDSLITSFYLSVPCFLCWECLRGCHLQWFLILAVDWCTGASPSNLLYIILFITIISQWFFCLLHRILILIKRLGHFNCSICGSYF